ncbi:PD-(D/E)XK motif protein [Micromonospora sp. WMMA1923]|uniref:PD-(D/E)XK motif protein n=1 Tax=Micromonospora sp. WMMA1923 TaxID=3404125 RepID=UPI003B954F0F
MTNTVEQVAELFKEMQSTSTHTPGTLRRRLRTDATHAQVYLEVEFPDRVLALAVRAPDVPDASRLPDTAGLRCSFDDHTVRVAAGTAVEAEMFHTLVADLVHHLSTAPHRPGWALVQRLTSWQRMLAAGLRTGLSAQAQLGLYGELLVLRELVLPVWGPTTVSAWVGPTGADQDFQRAGVAVEVKCAALRDAQRCRISNEAQLDTNNVEYLALIHQAVRTTTTAGVSLPEIIDAVRAEPTIAADPASFEDRLLHAGWLDLHRQQYERERYALVTRRCYRVIDGFPRITRQHIPDGVHAVAYSVDLDECAPFLVPQTDVVQRLAMTANLGALQ